MEGGALPWENEERSGESALAVPVDSCLILGVLAHPDAGEQQVSEAEPILCRSLEAAVALPAQTRLTALVLLDPRCRVVDFAGYRKVVAAAPIEAGAIVLVEHVLCCGKQRMVFALQQDAALAANLAPRKRAASPATSSAADPATPAAAAAAAAATSLAALRLSAMAAAAKARLNAFAILGPSGQAVQQSIGLHGQMLNHSASRPNVCFSHLHLRGSLHEARGGRAIAVAIAALRLAQWCSSAPAGGVLGSASRCGIAGVPVGVTVASAVAPQATQGVSNFLVMVATHYVAAGEELLLNYGKGYARRIRAAGQYSPLSPAEALADTERRRAASDAHHDAYAAIPMRAAEEGAVVRDAVADYLATERFREVAREQLAVLSVALREQVAAAASEPAESSGGEEPWYGEDGGAGDRLLPLTSSLLDALRRNQS